MQKTYNSFSTKKTPQSQPVANKKQVKNNAGGYAFQIDKWKSLDRFLIIGSEGGTYYTKAEKLTKNNAENVIACINEDGVRTVNRIIEISDAGRAPKNDPALFVLALASSLGDLDTRKAAFDALPKIARISTHLFSFVELREQFAGWGRLMRKAVANWYLDKDVDKLAYQIMKYKQRNGWSHRDILRLSHPSSDGLHNDIFKYICSGEVSDRLKNYDSMSLITECHDLPVDCCEVIKKYKLTREMVPTESLVKPEIWQALLPHMPMTALIRNLGNMTRIGAVKPLSEELKVVCNKLKNAEVLKKSRIHPVTLLNASLVYSNGQGMRNTWSPISQISDALDDAFYASFKNLKPTNKNIMIGLDVSGSMTFNSLAGFQALTARSASAALCLAVAKTEPNYYIMGFCNRFIDLNISPRERLDYVLNKINNLPFGRTDCALPMVHALKHNLNVDTFIIYTDNETWCGNIHPFQALQEYRRKKNSNAKLIVCAMTATDLTIADPSDAGMLDIVGLDSATPQLINDFILN